MGNVNNLKDALTREINAVNNLNDVLDFEKLSKAVDLISECKGNVIFAGCGSSSTVAFRAANIYNFLFIPSVALNVMNGLHGEYGMIRKGDIVVTISKSGNTKELIDSIPIAKKMGAIIIGLTETEDSYIGKESDVAIIFNSLKEIDDLDMVATSSTTCSSIILDIIGAAVMKKKGITNDDFELIHPYGAVGEMFKDK